MALVISIIYKSRWKSANTKAFPGLGISNGLVNPRTLKNPQTLYILRRGSIPLRSKHYATIKAQGDA